MFGKQKIAAMVAEFVGTYVLVSVVLGLFLRTDFPFFAAVAAGLAWTVISLTIGAASGAHLNPAVTLGMWTLRKIQTTEAAVYITLQMLAGYLALKLGGWLLGSGVMDTATKNVDWVVMTAEGLGGLVLGLGLAAVVYRAYDSVKAAVATGLALTLAMLLGSVGAHGLINPALAISVNALSVSYLLAPVVGTIVGMNLYAYLFANQKVLSRASAAPAKPVAAKVSKSKSTKKRK